MTLTAAYNFERVSRPVRLNGTAGATIQKGSALFYKVTGTETAGTIPGGTTPMSTGRVVSDTAHSREYDVEQCSMSNRNFFAGLLEETVTLNSSGRAEVAAVTGLEAGGAVALTNHSVTADDLLFAMPGSWYLLRGGFGKPLMRVIQTVDRSTTAGEVRGTLNPIVTDFELNSKVLMVADDFDSISVGNQTAAFFVAATSGGAVTARAEMRHSWISLVESSGTGTVVAGAIDGGAITMTPTATTDNAVITIYKPAAFICALGRPIVAEAILTPTEHNTDDMNVFFGAVDSGQTFSATVPLQADGNGPPANYSGACIFKVDGGTVWQAESSSTTTQNTDTDCGAFTTATQYKLSIVWDGISAWRFYINNTLVHTATTTGIPAASILLNFCLAVKAGSTTGTPNLVVNRISVTQPKANANF